MIFMRGTKGHYDDKLFSGQSGVYIGHVAVYIGEKKVVHAFSFSGKVIKENLTELIDRPNYSIVMVRRVLV